MPPENKNDIAPTAPNEGEIPYTPTPQQAPLAPQYVPQVPAPTNLAPPSQPPAQSQGEVTTNQAAPVMQPATPLLAAPAFPAPAKKESRMQKLKHRLHRLDHKRVTAIALLMIFFSASVFGAYLVGKKDQKIVFQEHPTQPLNLPPQAVVVAECVKGRGKQYVLPKDIPGGPIYDVVNDKVIAIEYNLNVKELVTNSDNFSNTILRLAKDYPIDHLTLIPIIPKNGGQVENALLVTFVVSKEEAKAITCENTGS